MADPKLHLECLIKCTQDVMTTYGTHKKSSGLIDYADMVCGAERLLRCDHAVRRAVIAEIDCGINDEFQDSNPVQFALLWQLGRHSPRTLLVGDVKQSILGFKGTDPGLSVALAKAHPEATDPSEHNWRSTPAVMEFVNALGRGLFDKAIRPLLLPAMLTRARRSRCSSSTKDVRYVMGRDRLSILRNASPAFLQLAKRLSIVAPTL